jgi:hypothetical protein
MKFLLTSLIITAIGVMAVPNPEVTPCTKNCHPVKPICPAGQEASGGEECWGCCLPIPVPTLTERSSETFCTEVCRLEKPVCPVGEAPSGSPGCWGCCQPTSPSPKPTPSPCIALCQPTKPVCPQGEAPTRSETCWGCCQPIGSF